MDTRLKDDGWGSFFRIPAAERRGAVTIAAWGEDQVRIGAMCGRAKSQRRGSSTGGRGARRGPRRNRDRSELGCGVRLVSFVERGGRRIPASDPNWPVEVLREFSGNLGDFFTDLGG